MKCRVYYFGCDLLSFYYLCRTGNNLTLCRITLLRVVICFHFTIFVVLETTLHLFFHHAFVLWFAFILLSLSYWKQRAISILRIKFSCDLLSFYYLCRTGNNYIYSHGVLLTVVICFHFTIFVVLETTPICSTESALSLWFAFILLSLSYWKQRYKSYIYELLSCDLLSFYYLCRTGNNRQTKTFILWKVVICFHFTIFVVLETTTKRGQR